MENASKALIMAGSVLMSILIITVLVFTFNSISNYKNVEDDSEEAKKLAEFNKQIEVYNNSTLYGSEILSLCNLVDDYNTAQTDWFKAYDKIDFKITISHITNNVVIQNKVYDYTDLIKDQKELEKKVEESGKTLIDVANRKLTAQKISGMRDTEIIDIYVKSRNGLYGR